MNVLFYITKSLNKMSQLFKSRGVYMVSKSQLIKDKAVELIKNKPEGIRYSELMRELQKHFPNTPSNTLTGQSWDLHIERKNEVYKPTRGLFKYRFPTEKQTEIDTLVQTVSKSIKEEDFYEPFADWIKKTLGECTEAVSLGGNSLGKKWGTPDVIGVYKPSKRDIIQFQTEIVSAEIKKDPSDPITAFGQAISYRLFSSKVYLVEPNIMLPEDQDRIEALCLLFGIGFILFDLNPKNPNFIIRTRAQRYIPDMFYVNEFADKLYNTNKEIFNKLF